MSYLNRLMAQTGMDFMPVATRVAPVSPIVEIDVQQIAAPQTSPVAPIASPAPAAANVPDRALSPAPIERTERVTAPSTLAQPAAPEASMMATRARAAEPLIPEIVIEQRPAQIVTEPAPRIVEQAMHQPSQPDPHLMAPPLTTAATKRNEAPPPEPRQPIAASKRPTLVEIRNWVAATPAADEPRTEPRAAIPEVHVSSLPERSVATRDASVVRRAEREPAPIPEAPHVELSIGALQVIVETPAAPVQPSRPQPPPPWHSAGDLPSWSRLSRRYIRL